MQRFYLSFPHILIYYLLFCVFRIVFISVIPVLVCCSVIILVRFIFSVIRIDIIFDIIYTILYIISDGADIAAAPDHKHTQKIPRKPDEPDRALSLVDNAGREILTVMADADTEHDVAQALAKMAGDDHRVTHADPFAVLRARAAWWLHFFDNINPIQS